LTAPQALAGRRRYRSKVSLKISDNPDMLSDRNDIGAHVQVLAGLRIPVTIKAEGGFELPGCRLLYQPSYGENLFVQLPCGQCPDNGAVQVTYGLHGAPYQFSCEINGKAGGQNDLEVLPVRLPKTIQAINRRLYIRTKFPLNDPLGFDICISRHNTMRVLAEDISAGGIGFFVPDNLNQFTLGEKYPIKLRLPESGEILTQLAVRNLRQLIGMHRIGGKFVALDAKHRMKIIELVSRCATRDNSCAAVSGAEEKIRILVDDQCAQPPLWPFLERNYDVLRGSLKAQALGRDSDRFELIILNLDAAGALETLKVTRNSARLRSWPLILASSRYATLPFNMPEVRFAPWSIPPAELTTTIDRLIYEYRWSQKVCRLDTGCPPASKILLLDRGRALPDHILANLECGPYDIAVIDDDRDLINRSVDINPDVLLIVHRDDRTRSLTICKLMNFNKKLKHKPKILLTADPTLAAELKAQHLVSQALDWPVESEILMQAIRCACS
jgi:PilZ domain